MDDARLIVASRKGDFSAFEHLVRECQDATYALAMARVSDRAAAEEIAQDVFVLVYQRLGQLRDPRRFGAWVRTITLRQCGIWLRSRKRDALARSLRGDETYEVQASRDDESGGFSLDIAAMISELPAGLRAAAVPCLQEGVSPSAAAAVLGIRPGAVRKRLHDARARLQFRIVEKAEREFRLHLLPRDFAERCVCRCGRSQEAKAREAGKEVISMSEKNCECACAAGRLAKAAHKAKAKAKK